MAQALAPARISASWARSETYGAPTEAVSPAFTGGVDDDSLFARCGSEVLAGLHEGLPGEPISLMLTDADGIVVSRLCDEQALIRALDQTYLAPGFAFGEREAGTNGLGLALADRVPSLVRGDEHYCTGLWGYTCAAAPVLDPVDGDLLGSINLTTWSQRSDQLLLALARTAAGQTSALMLARGRGASPRPAPRGEVFRVAPQASAGAVAGLSENWQHAVAEAATALRDGARVGVVGEPGAGKAALLATALRSVRPRHRVLHARPPAAADAVSWLSLWSPELGKPDTAVIAGRVHELPGPVATRLAALVRSLPHAALSLTAGTVDGVPDPLARLLDVVVEVPPLRHRGEDVMPLARHLVRDGVTFTDAAARALRTYSWPGNVEQLRRTVRDAAARSTVVDVRHLPPELLATRSGSLTKIESLERDELVRCLTEHGMSVTRAAETLGISRATAYRRVQRYGIALPR
ncbi:Fis family transcriptional regulator [Pseudonocardia sp. EC080610-09]|uniref:helix-turn-helix domain-containing protein n=1 Tax=unclassified Pseudonocardia TaxID=2619320 RepID=UPI0006CB4A85|nr:MULTISPECIES: helix-turn-helix domain-containing protein [unclassified Pseudonocardia]ALE75817.1 Fis family transcriptional regulator [Pseudonocardia sp. EC080625-04]ALL75195.1 Fis family transcriptional regulator [Pseudonocardia sp. EC080610-09]ALL82220.1 Fis family transcriptional regulator [Pseudonocardia sp. EC080619-01]